MLSADRTIVVAHQTVHSNDNLSLSGGTSWQETPIAVVGHSLLVTGYYLITRGQDYHDLGANYFDERNKEMVKRQVAKRLEKLGFQVQLNPTVSIPA